MNTIQFVGAIELGLIYSLVALGVYLSFRTLNFPDLTVDGSFPLGAAVVSASILGGVSPVMATILAMVAGALSGLVTAFLSTRLKMLNLLAGILTMSALYSINLRIMGRPNLALLGEQTILTPFLKIEGGSIYFLIILVALIIATLTWLLKTHIGLALRSTGSNPRMGRAVGINDHAMIHIGLALSNALVALGGALFAQVYGFADVSMGVGTIIIGLAAVIIGEAIFHARAIVIILISCIVGAIIYRLVIAFALNSTELGLQTSDLNLVTAVIVAVAMVLPDVKRSLKRGVS